MTFLLITVFMLGVTAGWMAREFFAGCCFEKRRPLARIIKAQNATEAIDLARILWPEAQSLYASRSGHGIDAWEVYPG